MFPSSARAHLAGKDDGLAVVRPVLDRVANFRALIADANEDQSFSALRAAKQTGRPLGDAPFIEGLERTLSRRIARRAPGRKPKEPMVEQASLL